MSAQAGFSASPRGLRNNNPLNLRRSSVPWLGKVDHSVSTDKDFEQFHEMWQGIRAAIKNAQTIERRTREAAMKFSVLSLISTWAPSSDGNDTTAYARFVSRKLGDSVGLLLTATDEIRFSPSIRSVVMRTWFYVGPIISAMIEVENGIGMGWQDLIAPDVYRQAARSAGVEGVPPEADEQHEQGEA